MTQQNKGTADHGLWTQLSNALDALEQTEVDTLRERLARLADEISALQQRVRVLEKTASS